MWEILSQDTEKNKHKIQLQEASHTVIQVIGNYTTKYKVISGTEKQLWLWGLSVLLDKEKSNTSCLGLGDYYALWKDSFAGELEGKMLCAFWVV